MAEWPLNPTDCFQNNIDRMLIFLILKLKVITLLMPLLVQHVLLSSDWVGGPVVLIEIAKCVKILLVNWMTYEQ